MNGGTLGPVKLSRPGCWLKYLPRPMLFLPIQQFLFVAHQFSTHNLYHFLGGIWRILFWGFQTSTGQFWSPSINLSASFSALIFCFADRSFFENPSNQISDSLSRLHRNTSATLKSNPTVMFHDVSIF